MASIEQSFNQPAITAPVFHPMPLPPAPDFGNILHVPQWGQSVAQAAGSILPSALGLKKELMQLPVEQQEANTALAQQAQAQQYIKDNAPNAQYNTTVNNGKVETGPALWNRSKAGLDIGSGPIPANSVKIGRDVGDTEQPQTPTPSTPATAPDQGTANPKAGEVPGSASTDTYGAQPTYDADALRDQMAKAANIPTTGDTSSPSPLDTPARAHFTPEEALAWYKQNVSTDAIGARQEFDLATGYPTNRNIISHKNPNTPDQPVHSAFIAQNPGAGGWQSDVSNTTNPVLASNPDTLKAAASKSISDQVTQHLLAQVSNPANAFQSDANAAIPNQTISPSAPLGPPTSLSLSGPPPNAPSAQASQASSPAQPPVQLAQVPPQASPDWASSPQATTAAISQVGEPLMAAAGKQAGTRTDTSSKPFGYAPGYDQLSDSDKALYASGKNKIEMGLVDPKTKQPEQPTEDEVAAMQKGDSVPHSKLAAAAAQPQTTQQAQAVQKQYQDSANRSPTSLPSFDPKDPQSWAYWTGSSSPEEFGKQALNPNLNGLNPKFQSTINKDGPERLVDADRNVGVKSQSMTFPGQDGQMHTVFIDPYRNGGKPGFSSIYVRSGVVGGGTLPNGDPDPNGTGYHEHREYLDGTSQDVDNKPLEAEITQNGQLAHKWGTIPPETNFANLSRADQESAYRQALQLENQRPLEGEDKDHVQNLWTVMQLAQHQQDVLSRMKPIDKDKYAKMANDFANENGARIPDAVGGFVKGLTGFDIQHPNPDFQDLLSTHDQMSAAVRALTSSKRYNEKGEQHLDELIGNPLGNGYSTQLTNFMKNYVYPDAGRVADMAMAQRQVLPKDFSDFQHFIQFGKPALGSSEDNPLIINNQQQLNGVPPNKGIWVKGYNSSVPAKQWGGVPKAELVNPLGTVAKPSKPRLSGG